MEKVRKLLPRWITASSFTQRAPNGLAEISLGRSFQDVVLPLKWKLIRIATGTSAPVGQPLHAAFPIAVEAESG